MTGIAQRAMLHDEETGAWLYVHHAQVLGTEVVVSGVMGDENVPMEQWVQVEAAFDKDAMPEVVEERALVWLGDEVEGTNR